jgi:hypothetical protein
MGSASEACELINMIRVLHPDVRNAKVEEKLLSLEKEVCSGGVKGQGSVNP